MPLPNITLAQFNAISNGDYNAGQIDFATGRNGETELVKNTAADTSSYRIDIGV